MMLKKATIHTFLRGGIHLKNDHKNLTESKPIERFVPGEVVIPLSQHLGEPAVEIVKRKTTVTRGDKIAEASPNGAAVHASVTGEVVRVDLKPHPLQAEGRAVVIQTADNTCETVFEEVAGWQDLSPETMLNHIAEAGMAGLGGAAFPTHRKLKLPPGVSIDELILNGAECEPYLTSDYRVMLESPLEVLWGAVLIARIIKAKRIIIGIEDNKLSAKKAMEDALKHESFSIPIRIGLCETRYPQGSEKQLVEALTGRVVPPRKLPMHVGIVVQNVATASACYSAIRYRKPLMDRVITVSGSGIMEPKNLNVPIGTKIEDIIAFCGGLHADTVKAIAGGPMMGMTIGRLDVPVIKGTGGLVFLRKNDAPDEAYGPCISCGRCLSACPLGLEPNRISIYTEAGLAAETESCGTMECFLCGCCAFVCPARRPLVQFIRIAKTSLATRSLTGQDGGLNDR